LHLASQLKAGYKNPAFFLEKIIPSLLIEKIFPNLLNEKSSPEKKKLK
jgi:hypothetical protein